MLRYKDVTGGMEGASPRPLTAIVQRQPSPQRVIRLALQRRAIRLQP